MEEAIPLVEMDRDSNKLYVERESRFLNLTENQYQKRLKKSANIEKRKKGNFFENCCDTVYECTRNTANYILCCSVIGECINACNAG